MPNGERSVLGGQVIIERIGREDGGEYQCWDLVTNKTNTHKYVNVLCEYDKRHESTCLFFSLKAVFAVQ